MHRRYSGFLAIGFLAMTGVPVLADSSGSGHEQDRVAGMPQMTESERAALDRFVQHEARFKDHYDSHYAKSGYGYNQYRPAYQHGFELALDQRYKKMDWTQLELQARRTWDDGTMGLWDRYKDAVRYGWEQGVVLDRG